MTRPVAALSSDLLVRKGMARPLGLEPTERTPHDVVLAVRPALAQPRPKARQLPFVAPVLPAIRSGAAVARLVDVWSVIAARWGLPTILFVVGVSMVTAVAVTGTAPGPAAASFAAPTSRPPGPTPVTWNDNGVTANPALAGR